MLQEDRNYLFKVAYHLQSRKHIEDKAGNKFVVFTKDDLDQLAESLRTLAEKDGERIARGDTKDNRTGPTRTTKRRGPL